MSPVAWGRTRLRVGVTAIIVAAGSGTRMGSGTPKQFLPLAGIPVLVRTLKLFADEPLVDDIVLVAPAQGVDRCRELVEQFNLGKVSRIVAGGAERQQSVGNGLQACSSRPRMIAVHDAVRPLLPSELLNGILLTAVDFPALAMAIPARDTIKEIVPDGSGEGALPQVSRTLPRSVLWQAQTPQVFWADVITQAYQQAGIGRVQSTDCASLVELNGTPVHLFPGSAQNIKLTTPEDFLLAEAILAGRAQG